MKRAFLTRWLLSGLIAAGALGAPVVEGASRAPAQPEPAAGLRILESNATEMRIELTIGAFITETVSINGSAYQRLTGPGFGQSTQPGAPQVPVRGALLGLPTVDGVQVALEAQDIESVAGLRLAPAPTVVAGTQNLDGVECSPAVTETLALDQHVYSANAFYPGPLVTLGQVGYLRDQAVAQIQFNPVQYNPVTGETRLAHRLVARLTWSSTPSAAASSPRAPTPEFEAVLQQSILNYTSLTRPGLAPAEGPTTPPSPQLAATGTITLALKIGITSSGIYTLSYATITAAGFNLAGVDPRTLKIKHRGAEVPIRVIGEADGVFNPQDYVIFYGAAYEDVYTNVDVYWLEAGGANGLRMATPDATPAGASSPQDFPAHLHAGSVPVTCESRFRRSPE